MILPKLRLECRSADISKGCGVDSWLLETADVHDIRRGVRVKIRGNRSGRGHSISGEKPVVVGCSIICTKRANTIATGVYYIGAKSGRTGIGNHIHAKLAGSGS